MVGEKTFFNGAFLLFDFDMFTFIMDIGLPKIPNSYGDNSYIDHYFNHFLCLVPGKTLSNFSQASNRLSFIIKSHGI